MIVISGEIECVVINSPPPLRRHIGYSQTLTSASFSTFCSDFQRRNVRITPYLAYLLSHNCIRPSDGSVSNIRYFTVAS